SGGKDGHGCGGRQRGAAPAAADRDRRRDRRGKASAGASLCPPPPNTRDRAPLGGGRVSASSVPPFLEFGELTAQELRGTIEASRAMKERLKRDRTGDKPLKGKTLAMIFDRPSTRTRVSFDVGMRQLGGESITLTGQEMQLGRGETIADTARVLSRYVDGI